MLPNLTRHLTTRTFIARLLLVASLATGAVMSFGHDAAAQHSGHVGHDGRAVAKPSAARTAPAVRPGSAKRRSGAHFGRSPSVASVREFHIAHASMMRAMAQPYTGDVDIDFRVHMIPHHQGAIDMARVAMRHAQDPWTRQLAEAVIVEQQREIAEMQAWLARRGVQAPAGGRPTHIIGADSFRSIPEEPGTRAKARGQSWAPGSGIR